MARFGSTKEEHSRRAQHALAEVRDEVKAFNRALKGNNCSAALNRLVRAERWQARYVGETIGAGRKRVGGVSSQVTNKLLRKFARACVR